MTRFPHGEGEIHLSAVAAGHYFRKSLALEIRITPCTGGFNVVQPRRQRGNSLDLNQAVQGQRIPQ